MSASISLTESQQFTALRNFLISIMPDGMIIQQGQSNRVAEPNTGSYIIYWPIYQRRLSTNIEDTADNIIVANINGTVLNVSNITQQESSLGFGSPIADGTAGQVLAGTTIISQINGVPGGIGTYTVNKTQTVASETMYAGSRDDLVPNEWHVQVDVHGDNSADYAKTIEGLFRSDVATEFFDACGYDMQALYCDDATQTPFIGGEQQYQERWTLTLQFQINPVIKTPQQFFIGPLDVGIIDVDAAYPIN